ncbi:MAG TPA: 2-amino-4-hydroxy-6-hydroxymethyldihydropteridine diphosphokinase [Pirellulales bacterium]|jgi:2-amino-4-hydroxy-6-hydroxymethyldihydropteridine diphosphokinase
MALCLVALGANIGDRRGTLLQAVAQLAAAPGVTVRAESGWQDTLAVGGPPEQPEYLNGAVLLETSLAAPAVLSILKQIEVSLGRVRDVRWGPRTVDLDLLLYDDLVLTSPDLTVPHPRMAFRRFVIEPAAEIAGWMRHPTIGWTLRALRDHLRHAVPYVAIAGFDAAARIRLAANLASQSHGRLISAPFPVEYASGTGADSTGPVRGRAIELLDSYRRLLDRDQWAELSRLAVSDFWIEQPCSDASSMRLGQVEQEFALAVAAARTTTMRPKLLILLDPPTNLADANQRARALAVLAQRPGVGPLLHLTNASPEENLAQAVAAVEAMT